MWKIIILFSLVMPVMAATPICKNTIDANVLVELFTSEGCSSCPPADNWLADTAHQVNTDQLITLAWHVDYWDYLGWKDKLANPQFSDRQRERVAASGSNNVYTPQVMINGKTVQWYKQPDAIIRQQLLQTGRPAIQLNATEQNKGDWLLIINTDMPLKNTVLRAALLGDTTENKITTGENAGRLLRHPSPVLAYSAQVHNSVVLNPQNRKAVRAVAWLEKKNQSEVLAISSVNLRDCTNPQ